MLSPLNRKSADWTVETVFENFSKEICFVKPQIISAIFDCHN